MGRAERRIDHSVDDKKQGVEARWTTQYARGLQDSPEGFNKDGEERKRQDSERVGGRAVGTPPTASVTR